ncbi:flagellar basal-body MS-ring/collar protein FliF, partial [Pseudooceanicola nitratireducens]|uniref:flagellar basal-body MS-ring/collar protein FliF n=1 Tax=Pseudooceanicola nitratireducens TaxID=517719 RepID=UPI003518BFEF
ASVQALLENLRALGQGRLIALGVTGVILVLATVFGIRAVMEPSYSTLYRDLTPSEASRMVGALEGAGFNVTVDSSGSILSVPQEDLARARMELAGQGLVSDGSAGWELFDEASGLGMNSFMQKINRLRALEGELARSIQTLNGVEAARVHLVLPEREAFSRDRPQPSGSVIVRPRPGHQVTVRQAQSIRALVSSAVPEMSAGNVTVLTASGETVLAEEGQDASEVTQQALKASVEDRIASNVTEILTARVGAGNARVKVSVDLTTERQVIREQSYDPEQRVVRSTETREETREDMDRNSGEVGVVDDIPASLAESGGATSQNSVSKTDEVVNYEIGNKQSETIREPGEIQRISVAVLVNGIYNVLDNGEIAYEERTPEELERLNQLVQAAIGFNETRGDSISVDSLRFMDYSMDVGDATNASIVQILKDNLMSILRALFVLAVIAAILRFGVKPLLASAMPKEIEGEASGDTPALPAVEADGESGDADAGDMPDGLPAPAQAAQPRPRRAQQGGVSGQVLEPMHMAGPDDIINIGAVHGGVHKGWINTVSGLIESQPEDSLKVVKTWLAEGA